MNRFSLSQPVHFTFISRREVGNRRKKEGSQYLHFILFPQKFSFGQTVIAVSNDTNLKGNRRRLQTGLWAYQQEYVATNC